MCLLKSPGYVVNFLWIQCDVAYTQLVFMEKPSCAAWISGFVSLCGAVFLFEFYEMTIFVHVVTASCCADPAENV